MINSNTMRGTYIVFNSSLELQILLKEFSRLGFNYKFGSHEDAIRKADSSVVNKITFNDQFVLTSKEKVTTMAYKAFMNVADSITNDSTLTDNNNKNTTMKNTDGNPRAILNEMRSTKLFKDEDYIESLAVKGDSAVAIVDQFVATLEKAEDKANKVAELVHAYTDAISARDVAEIERLGNLIDSSIKYITKTNKILAGITESGEAIIKANTKEDKNTGAKFIGE